MSAIPFMNLKCTLRETEAEWRPRWEALLERAHFILGPELEGFEGEFAEAMGAQHAVGVGTGTSGLELVLRAAGLGGSGGEVITTPLTAPFTGLAIVNAGCRPVFADVDPDTLLLDAETVEQRIGEGTAALMPVHLYGQACDLTRFAALARRSGAVLVQDACQAHGAQWQGKPLAAYSPCVAYSFYPTKNLGALGDAGAVVTNNRAMREKLRLLRDGGRTAGHVCRVAGVNSRLDEMQACFLRAFLPRLEGWNQRRRRLAELYQQALGDCQGVRVVRHSPDSVFHLFVIRAQRRKELREYLTGCGIGTAIHYPVPLHLQPGLKMCGQRRGDLPNAERACREILSLPLWPGLEESAVETVAEKIRSFYSGGRGKRRTARPEP
jgi:dTDP-3-amino-3,4,6-trideoxy-alpha-D-glucose transaminase